MHFIKNSRTAITVLAIALPLSVGVAMAASGAASTPVSPSVNRTVFRDPNLLYIYGSGFGAGSGTVTFNGTSASVITWSENALTVYTSSKNPSVATYSVVVTTASGQSITSSAAISRLTLASSAADRDNTAFVNAVSVNGGSNQEHVAPGAAFIVEFNYATVCSGSACPIAIQVGLNTGAPQACFLASQQNSNSGPLTLVAPTQPGIYYLLFDRNQNFCGAEWDYGTPPLSQSIGSILVY